jgi:hypothetical protein
MRASRRRTRRRDNLASPDAVRHILAELRRRCPDKLSSSERQVRRMLESVRHYEKRPIVDESRGRPRRWPRRDVVEIADRLRDILTSNTEGRISISSFVSLYLPILHYPADVTRALSDGRINIRESAHLARLTPEKLNCASREARQVRTNILNAHLLTRGSQESLRRRTQAALGTLSEKERHPDKAGWQIADELVNENPHDSRHLFYDESCRLIEAMRDIKPEDLKGKNLVEFLRQLDRLISMLSRAKKRR